MLEKKKKKNVFVSVRHYEYLLFTEKEKVYSVVIELLILRWIMRIMLSIEMCQRNKCEKKNQIKNKI